VVRELFVVKALTDNLDAGDLRELFDEFKVEMQTVGQIADHTPGIENETNPYRHLSQEEMEKAIGCVNETETVTGGPDR